MNTILELKDIAKTIEDVINSPVDISKETHLIKDDVVDSLDSAVFLLEIEKLVDIKLTDKDIDERDLFKVSNLLEFVNGTPA